MAYPRFSKLVQGVLSGMDIGATVLNIHDRMTDVPYVLVTQVGGGLDVVQVGIGIFAKTIDSAHEISDKIYDGLRHARVQGHALSLQNIKEMYSVQDASEARIGLEMTYNIPVNIGRR